MTPQNAATAEPPSPRPIAVTANQERKRKILEHAERMASGRLAWKRRNAYFHEKDLGYLRFMIPEGAKVLELGCGVGDLLANLKPSFGVGVDVSPAMVEEARRLWPDLTFHIGDMELPETLAAIDGGPFDFIVLSDTIGSLEDCQRVFESLHPLCDRNTRIVVGYYNYVWEMILRLAERLHLKMPQTVQNFLAPADIKNLFELAGYDVVNQQRRILSPRHMLGLGELINRLLAPMPIINRAALRDYTVARSRVHAGEPGLSASVVIPCRNERGNIETALKTMPRFSSRLEIIFIEGHSQDGTQEEIDRVAKVYADEFDIKTMTQPGKGKGDAVRAAFDAATGDVLMILDADLTVAPEELPKFFNLIEQGQAEFVNGSRLVYPMEEEAMRFLNLIANSLFARAFSWLLGQRVTDTLCGTKVLKRLDYERTKSIRTYFDELDPFGDFDLLFGAARGNLKIVEVPIRYRGRAYGETQISRFRHGWMLLKMAVLAFRKMKAI